jgi:hypothetical protein
MVYLDFRPFLLSLILLLLEFIAQILLLVARVLVFLITPAQMVLIGLREHFQIQRLITLLLCLLRESLLIYSTDAISWTSVTIPSISAPQDIFYNGTRLVAIGSTTAAAYSSDLGVTWTLTTLPSITLAANFPGSGVITWSQSAGLFLIATSTAGTYYTSPDGITWTSRTVAPSIYNSFIGTQVKFASSPSKIVAMGLSGFFLTSTDGLNWTSGSISGIAANTQCVQSYYDGTRFVVRYGTATYYSTDGTTWTTAKFIGSSSGTSSYAYSNGILFVFCSVAANVPTKAIKVQNVSLTSPQTISNPTSASVSAGTGGTVIYYRIR